MAAVYSEKGMGVMTENTRITKRDRRITVFCLLFAREFNKEADLMEFYRESCENAEVPFNSYVEKTFIGTCENSDKIDVEIEAASLKWKMSRMARVTRSILRLAVYELLYTESPAKAIINEAIELAKEYDDDAAPAFINGILNKIARSHGMIAEETENISE